MLLLQSTPLARAYFLHSDLAQLERMLGPAGAMGPRRQVRTKYSSASELHRPCI